MLDTEWLETNGLGGWASSSVSGALTRSYHGLLVDGSEFPQHRYVMLSKFDETIVINGKRYELGCNQFSDAISPEGFLYIQSFTQEIYPIYVYAVAGVTLKKEILGIHGYNTTLVRYSVISAPCSFSLEYEPFIAAREHHTVVRANNLFRTQSSFEDATLYCKPYENIPPLFIKIPGASYEHCPKWYLNFEYLHEYKRGLAYQEDLMRLGRFTVSVKENATILVSASTSDLHKEDLQLLWDQEIARRYNLFDRALAKTSREKILIRAADQFIVRRKDALTSIVAGYPWFTDWGRDTMIALPGLCLTTGRAEEAREILLAYASYMSFGMIPNRFVDGSGEAEYGSVDATLWWIIACYKYFQATSDMPFLYNIIDKIEEAISWYKKGTRYQIKGNSLDLIEAGDPTTQLTWMDARVREYPETPRNGLSVEVNGLWINALFIYAHFLQQKNQVQRANEFQERALKARHNFIHTFWDHENSILFDYINGDYTDRSIRPNQLIAISLPFEVVPNEYAEKILVSIEEQLLTQKGIRTLSPKDSRYRSRYCGNVMQRDSAYHQGTVWPWLLGPYISTLIRVRGQKGREQASAILNEFLDNEYLNEGCVGTVSEIFDGDAPHKARGCPAQAWSVGEILVALMQTYVSDDRAKRQLV
jgi:predicted glycogen debranching enzyme